jgi:CRISPR-associated endonuclease/helicase Cas3
MNFDDYFEALNGVKPFPWQRRLVSQVLASGRWPSSISLPTASGKTAILDIAVFCLASQGKKGNTGRRIFYIVDRRVVVDQAYERAESLARKLTEAKEGILSEVAKELMRYGGSKPLAVARLRGAMYRDESWAASPSQPIICVSTVDQVGSRLLFRGYGLSNSARPIHAALIANDSLIILDEAHISIPFGETLRAIERYRSEAWAGSPLNLPFAFVRMSATSHGAEFSLAEEDIEDPVLGKRIKAHKEVTLHKVPDEKFEEKAVELAMKIGKGATAVVINTVVGARAILNRLMEKGVQAVLLTGRSRPYERDALVKEIIPRIGANRDEYNDRLFVVATQCIEVGVDFDFDTMLTECASMDSLIQRFGRMNRFGKRTEEKGAIIIRQSQTSKPDWLYGEAMKKTWEWLSRNGRRVDFSPAGIRSPPVELLVQQNHAPVMLPAYMDAWVQTGPPPAIEPDIALFLHGATEDDSDVQVVWRIDLDEDKQDTWADTVSLLPPSLREAMQVPVHSVKAWLASEVASVSDLEMQPRDERRITTGRRALLWRGPDNSKVVGPAEVKPGDTIVVPSNYGGADRFGWYPDSKEPVQDIAELVSFERGLPVLRLHGKVMKSWFSSAEVFESFVGRVEELPPESDYERMLELLQVLKDSEEVRPEIRKIASSMLQPTFERYPSGDGWIVRERKAVDWNDEESSFQVKAVTLLAHSKGVQAKAERYAKDAGLPDTLVKDISLAAFLHDVGKADPRFQAWLRGGDELAALRAGEPIAKSVMYLDKKEREAARIIAGYPKGGRHEALSAHMVMSLQPRANDPDLLLHLVSSHHGYSRPFLPVVEDGPVDVRLSFGEFEMKGSTNHGLWRLDGGTADRFWSLIRRYGYYGLSFLEALLRLADHIQSAEEQGSS